MELIYHEKQEGYLCGLHCLNSLLQSKYFTEFDLASLANEVDQQERSRMAEGGESEEYKRFIQEKSRNIDDSGFFSIEVIIRALKVWNLEVINYNSSNEIAKKARENPTTQNAFICNLCEHWFTIRKIGKQFFNLNSLLSFPELLSDTYIHLFLAQLQQEGYSIFIVIGKLPQCQADNVLSNRIVTQINKPKVLNVSNDKSKIKKPSNEPIEQDCIDMAIRESLMQSNQDHDRQLQQAISLSMQEACSSNSNKNESLSNSLENLTEQELLEKAISMSLSN